MTAISIDREVPEIVISAVIVLSVMLLIKWLAPKTIPEDTTPDVRITEEGRYFCQELHFSMELPANWLMFREIPERRLRVKNLIYRLRGVPAEEIIVKVDTSLGRPHSPADDGAEMSYSDEDSEKERGRLITHTDTLSLILPLFESARRTGYAFRSCTYKQEEGRLCVCLEFSVGDSIYEISCLASLEGFTAHMNVFERAIGYFSATRGDSKENQNI